MSTPSSASDSFCGSSRALGTAADESRWFKEEVQPLEKSVRGYVRQRFPDIDTDDVLQESYVKLFKAKAAGKILSTPAYFFSVCRNTALRFLRRPKGYSEVPLADSPALKVVSDEPNSADVATRSERFELMAQAIAELPPRCREIVKRAYFEEKSHQEIAEEMGLAVNTIRAQLGFGIKKCADFLRARGERP